MKVYHYASKGNTVLKEGILSFSQNPNADLSYYYKRSGKKSFEDICQWLENCFAGRSRGIRVFSEPIQWTSNSLSLKKFVENTNRFSIDLQALQQDGFLEDIYVSPSVMDTPDLKEGVDFDEVLIKLSSIEEIGKYAVDWTLCNDKLGRRFAFVPYYLLIIKGGIIPPEYIILEDNLLQK